MEECLSLVFQKRLIAAVAAAAAVGTADWKY